MNEEWKWIKGYKGLYEVSNTGKVKSHHKNPKILKVSVTVYGYGVVQLSKNGKYKSVIVHTLVAKYFCDGYKQGLVVNHVDGDKLNNFYRNLEWVTHKENIRHSRRMGLNNAHGEAHYLSKLTVSDVNEIRNLSGNISQKEIGKLYGVSQPVISDIINNKIWKNCIHA